jgi:hypothetical protein
MDELTSDTGTATVTETDETDGFDMDSAVEKISAELFPKQETASTETPVEPASPETTPSTIAAAPTLREVPKSWPKEMHEHWGKMDPKVMDYWDTREQQMLQGLNQYKGDAQYGKTLKDVIAPFEGVLQQYRLEPHQAVQSLMNAHVRLTQGTPESRRAAYEELGRNLGITPSTQPGQQASPVDPQLQALQQQFQQMQQTLTTREQADYQAAQTRVTQEVDAFASDTKAHPYFTEVADDITALLKGGVATSLQDAYDRAVRMNPVTYAKEVAVAQQAEVAKQQENSRLNALKAKTAASTNVRGRESKRTPTEPLGTMEDTIKETLRQQRARPLTH